MRKDVGSDSTEYIYFGGQAIAERNPAGEWSDYIYAGGRRLARSDDYEDRIHTWGTRCGGCGAQWDYFQIPSSFNTNLVIQAGDRLFLRQWQSAGTRAGMLLHFTDGTNTSTLNDQDGWPMPIDGVTGTWHWRFFDLTAFAGKTLNYAEYVTGIETTAIDWHAFYHDVALVQANGTVLSFYNGQKSVSLNSGSLGGGTNSYAVDHLAGTGQWSALSTQFYHGDHLGSSRTMTSSAGYPVWSATYLPFGQEHNPQPTVNHFKFTGKERDTESGLDFFIARYYSSQQGRFLSPDEFTGGPVDAFSSNDPLPPGPLPYAGITNPQSLNKYAYTYNNPLRYTDPNGHCPIGNCLEENIQLLKEAGGEAIRSHGLDAAGFAPPPVGPAADGANVLLSLAKGDFTGAAVNAFAMIPLFGDAFKGGKMASKAADVLAANKKAGKLAEETVKQELKTEGKEILGSQVTARSGEGRRVIDHLVDGGASPKAVEVKSGGATRTKSQVRKDEAMAKQGATLVGKNAPPQLRGQTIKIETEVRKPKS